jgi:hypothetical protein
VALQPSGELELQQHAAHDGGRGAGQTDQVVEADRARSEQIDDAGALAGIALEIERFAFLLARRA